MDSRVVQTGGGTWMAEWHSIENTPPMEERAWMCQKCFEQWHDLMAKIPMFFGINWENAEKEIGKEQAERLRCVIENRRVRLWERVERVCELGLRGNVYCVVCKAGLTRHAEALVEAY
jgi:hypothetical protein